MWRRLPFHYIRFQRCTVYCIIIVGVVIALFFVASVCCLIIFRCEYHCGAGVVVDTFHPWFVLLLSIWFLRGVVFLKPCILEGLSLCFVPVRIQYLDETDERMCYCLLNVPFDISVFWKIIVGFWLRISGFRWENEIRSRKLAKFYLILLSALLWNNGKPYLVMRNLWKTVIAIIICRE